VRREEDFDWDDLKYFLGVVRSGSLRGAAKGMRANHVTIARRLAALEDGVGGRLFDRSQGGLVLTQLGEDLLPHAQRVEDEITAAARTIVGRDARPGGTILLSMPHAIAQTAIMEDLAQFSDEFPAIDLNISLTNNLASLTRREADVSIRVANKVTDDVVGRKLVPFSSMAYCSPDYAARIQDNGGRGLSYIGWDEAEGETSAKWIEKGSYPKAVLRHRMREFSAQMGLAAAGAGLCHIPCCLGDRHPNLVRAPFQKATATASLWLLLHRDLRKTARVRLFVDFLAEHVRKRKNEFWVGMGD